jgi:hypothetical protein
VKTFIARPTTYKGIAMRSRLEARYAAGLDRQGVRWAYEPRAYANGQGQYLPDFELLNPPGGVPVFIEVRPTLERAYQALAQMQIVLDSVPDAFLMVDIPGECAWFSCPGARLWRLVA